ncbi:phosphotransferase [Kineococcus sp. T13]|uniref:phosphotransferase n=1 Tax=Kineococcus vitellinus TaxID=2696565 RepID=UPI001412C084|nr:phosphotransferase [Kineococcus vitellinus]NAZ75154.1 phosphotransferase [Kineococcus vitellinus]
MSAAVVEGVERAVFGPLARGEVDAWLDGHVETGLGSRIAEVLLRAGRISAVYGLRLHDGREVAVKVHRLGADLVHLRLAARAQRVLAEHGYPCPLPLHGPVLRDGRAVVVETLLRRGRTADATLPAVRTALAVSLAEQVEVLRAVPAEPLRPGAPAWARYEGGPWPAPHDPLFDFGDRSPRADRVDALAARAAAVLREASGADVAGHSDWYDGNVLVEDRAGDRGEDGAGNRGEDGPRVSAAFDWDSLTARPEAELVGMSAGSHTAGGPANAVSPAVEQVAAFLDDYERARSRPFSARQRAAAAAAACWVLTYNARCDLCFLPADAEAPPGSALAAVETAGPAYLRL